MKALNISATGMKLQEQVVAVISNNIANSSTTAYDFQIPNVIDLGYEIQSRGASNTTQIQFGLGAKLQSVSGSEVQGSLIETGLELDLALEGDGYFQVDLDDGRTGYTRDGSLRANSDGFLTVQSGFPLSPNIIIPDDASQILINRNGEVLVRRSNDSEFESVGQIEIAQFLDGANLDRIGSNILVESPASGSPQIGLPGEANFGRLRQGYLEGSSVNVVQEITRLIEAQRAYEFNSQVLRSVDEMMANASSLR